MDGVAWAPGDKMGMTISPSRHTMSAIQPELADGGTGCEGLITTLYLDGLEHVLP